MKEEKDKLRNQLFEKYFENQEGIILNDFVKIIEPIVHSWQNLYKNLLDNCSRFDMYSQIEKIKLIERNSYKYLFIKTEIWEYIVINLSEKKVLIKDEVIERFDEAFFCNNFNEEKLEKENQFYRFYRFYNYKGNIDELVDLYLENENIFNCDNKIVYEIVIGDAYTYININLTTGKIYLSFETPNQFLYDQLWFNPDLTPSNMQDAISKIGINKMNEMFERIKDIVIPYDVIPDKIYGNLEMNQKVLKK